MDKGRKQQKSLKEKAARYCAIEERSQQQVREKLRQYGAGYDETEEILAELISNDFINEERFARAYVRGKFRIKKWGRNKILQGLYPHRLSDYCIKKGFEEIDPVEYQQALLEWTEKYASSVKGSSSWEKKNKTSKYLIGKGYDPAEVYECVNGYFG